MTKSERSERHGATHRESGWAGASDLEVRQLRAFVLLVDHGSMSAAARALGVAQSTVSEVVAALERALATRIVARRKGGRGVALTPAGEALLPHARRVLSSLEDAQLAVAEVDRDVRASVEVIANESISTYLLPPALGEVRRRWPNMRFAVTVGMCPRITAGLSTGRYDVGLMLQTPRCPPTEPDESPDSRRVLSHVSLLLFASPAHPLASGGDVPREALPPYTVFVSDARGYFHDLVRDFFRSDGVPMPRLEPTGSVEAVKQSVITDPRGVGVLPAYALGAELDAGTLCAIDVRPALPRVRLEAMLYRTRAPAHPAVTTLLDELRASLHDADTETSDVWPARRSADAEPLRPRL